MLQQFGQSPALGACAMPAATLSAPAQLGPVGMSLASPAAQAMPAHVMPAQKLIVQTDQKSPAQKTPAQVVLAQRWPSQNMSVKPAQKLPAQKTLAHTMPAQRMPMQAVHTQPAPAQAMQAQVPKTAYSVPTVSGGMPVVQVPWQTDGQPLSLYWPHQQQFSAAAEGPQQLFAASVKAQDKLVGVMVTIAQGSSYDENFRQIEPTTVPGERVSTYLLQCCDVGKLHDFLAGASAPPPAPSPWALLLADIGNVPADSVTFNWECCSGCDEQGFPPCAAQPAGGRGQPSFARAAPSATMRLAGLAVQRGFTVMFSDFSLKALLAEWSEQQLGPNPFLKLQQACNHQFVLDFLPAELQNEDVPQQLQVVGELCAEQGRAVVSAMGNTIVYTLNPQRAQTKLYELKVLTVVSEIAGGLGMPEALKCSVGGGGSEKRGAAGHVTLTYASGGQLVTSMGHWIELTRLNTSEEAVMEVAARHFGVGSQVQFATAVNSCSSAQERRDCVQSFSKQMVQQSMPSRMKERTKFSAAPRGFTF